MLPNTLLPLALALTWSSVVWAQNNTSPGNNASSVSPSEEIEGPDDEFEGPEDEFEDEEGDEFEDEEGDEFEDEERDEFEDEEGGDTDSLEDWESPVYNQIYQVPLPIPPIKEPSMKIPHPNATGEDIWYYEVEIKPFTQAVYPDLGQAALVGYDGMSPGPTFVVPRGTESIVRFVNNADMENSVHLHGSYSRAPFDGWAEDVTQPSQYKDYYYPNSQPGRMLWYHDHAMSITAENANMGQAGVYIIQDAAEEELGLPSGYGEFDIPLVLTSKFYNVDGTLVSLLGEEESVWGDIIHVNGQPWPFLNVEPRKYRFRFLNAAVSRSWALYFAQSDSLEAKLPFNVIASDAGLLGHPVEVSDLFLSIAERYEIVFDFSPYAGQSIDLRNLEKVGGFGTDDDYENTDKVMRFVVSPEPPEEPDTSVVPEVLREVPFPSQSEGIDHHFRFERTNSEWRINGVGFADVENRILANVPLGTVEIWELENSSGGWTHPIHIHLVDFRVVSREGDREVMPYEEEGLKDVVWLARGETVRVEAHYAPWPGVYMFHCHNLIHEDHDMMAAFNVTVLPELGYGDASFIDPMAERWRAQPYEMTDLRERSGPFREEAIVERVEFLTSFEPYRPIEGIGGVLEKRGDDADCGDALSPSVRWRKVD